jgi:hypothetical protein
MSGYVQVAAVAHGKGPLIEFPEGYSESAK